MNEIKLTRQEKIILTLIAVSSGGMALSRVAPRFNYLTFPSFFSFIVLFVFLTSYVEY